QRNPHHVRRGLAHFVVQACGRQERFEKGRRGQRRSGGRRLMRPGRFLGLALLAAICAAAPVRAEDAAESCDVPASLLETESSLPKAEAAVKPGQPLDILVIGSRSSTTGSSDNTGIAYPARLQAALKDKLSQLTVNVSVEIQAKKSADEVVGG